MKKFKFGLISQFILVVVMVLLFGKSIPTHYKELILGISYLIKSTLIFILPIIVFSYLFSSILMLGRNAFVFIVSITFFVCLSNSFSTIIGYGVGKSISSFIKLPSNSLVNSLSSGSLSPAFEINFPKVVSNDMALFAALILGIIFSLANSEYINNLSIKLKEISNLILGKLFIPLLPVLVLGFLLKFQHDKMLEDIFILSGKLLLIIFSVIYSYIAFLYFISSGFNPKKFLFYIKNIVAPATCAFATMSSAIAMPTSIKAAEINTDNSENVKLIIPTTVNIHLIGDSIMIPVLALVILQNFNGYLPDISQYLVFACFFVLAKFAVAAVPGGGIITMIPVLESYLGFSGEMSAIITALYIFFDDFTTVANVTGNGAFCILFDKFVNKFLKFRKTSIA